MTISVIIPTYNEAEDIQKCLESLMHQSLSDFEVIVVDDGSTDKTFEVLSELKIKNLKLKIMHGVHTGAGAARNLGVKHAKGDILVFVDADMTFDVNFLEKLTQSIRKNFTKGTFSKEEYVANWDNIWTRCWNLNENWQDKRRHPKDYPDNQPVFRAILRSEFDKVGGFTPGGYDDDWSLSKKLGYEAVNAPAAIFYHKNPSTLAEIFNQAKWVGKRKYKYGYYGYMAGMIRASLPISIIIGLYKGIMINDLRFMIFKIVYDFGVFIGILEYLLIGKSSK
jgi:poly-beta-1,6-N-acetyl-D-glucosamine synthase